MGTYQKLRKKMGAIFTLCKALGGRLYENCAHVRLPLAGHLFPQRPSPLAFTLYFLCVGTNSALGWNVGQLI
jgi:hypothetical protein